MQKGVIPLELFRLLGTIAIQNKDANEALEETSEQGEKTQNKLGNAFDKIGSAAVKVGKVVAAGMAAGGAALVAIGKQAVESYAEYEQLVGGSQLMFGEAYDFIADKAANAYKNVQMSANDYLQQVNGFSVGLKTALNGDAKAAAELADKIITAEADIVAATGNSQEAVQNAFNGIMKSNFTMLDNLQLGITPTKEGFQEVIDKVNEWNAANGKATSYVIDNLADCQAALVDYVAMQGLAGYAANEGAATISGSIAAMKASWQNLLTGMADENQNLDALFSQFVNSVVTVGDNLIPRIQTMLPRIVDGISQLAKHLATNIPPIVESLLPSVLTGAVNIVAELVKNIPSLVSSIVAALVSTLQSYFSTIQENGAEMLEKITTGIEENLPKIVEKAVEIISKLAEGLANNLPTIIKAAGEIIMALVQGLVKSLPSLLKKAPEIIGSFAKAIIGAVGQVKEAGKSIMSGMWNGMKSVWSSLSSWVSDKLSWITDKFNAVKNFVSGIKDAVTGASSTKTNTSSSSVKAHAAGGILTKPTIFGYTPSTGTYHLGGEAGAEAIAPIDVLQGYVREAVAEANQNAASDKIYEVLAKILYMLQNNKITAVMDGEKMGEFVIQTVEREVYA